MREKAKLAASIRKSLIFLNDWANENDQLDMPTL
jgi:hypothetical protein